MIKLTRLDGSELTINANLIEIIEANPDTVITLVTNKRFIVRETPEEIAERVINHYKKSGGPRLIIYENQCYRPDEYAS